MSSLKRSRAFTLIEVLIALLIIAIALGAVVRATTQSVLATTHVRNTMGAHWVAMNVLSEMQTGLLPVPHAGDVVRGKTKMLRKIWHWRASLQADSLSHIVISVLLKGLPVTSVSGAINHEAS